MPLQVTDPIETVERLTTQEVLDFRLTQTVPDGIKSVSVLVADLLEDGTHAQPPSQRRIEIPLIDEETGDIHVPASFDEFLPDEIKALGLDHQALVRLAFGITRPWSYAVLKDNGMLADGELV
ncbi:MAG: hypothetical protein AAGE01_10345 [Pseudomonadota bacterium]